jgi:hypothetical protein
MSSKSVHQQVKSLQEAAKLLGHKGGEKGGPARARDLSPGRRKQIAAMGGKASHKDD